MVPSPTSPQAFNRYSYVLNNPMKLTDPSGHKCVGEADECVNDKGKPINGAGGLKPNPKKHNGDDDSDLAQSLQQQIQACQQNILACQGTNSQDGIYPVKQEFHWSAVDWWDVGINLVGIGGDIALASTVVGDLEGPEVWLVTEGVEIVGIMRDEYNGDFNALKKDGIAKAVDVIGDLKRSAILAPAFGFVFNISNIADAFEEGYVDVPDYGPYTP